MIRLGLVVNPVAGLGGRVGLGGSDGTEVQRRALSLGAVPCAGERAAAALAELACRTRDFELVTASGAMGEAAARTASVAARVVYRSRLGAPGTPGATGATGPRDTVEAVRALVAEGVGLLLFAGGDGTARDVLDALGEAAGVPVLGIPTGVKMHSAVFAVNPRAAGEVAATWASARTRPQVRDAEVMDRDEAELRLGRLTSRLYGWLPVPYVPVRVQQRKAGSTVVPPEAVGGIAAELASRLTPDEFLILGPGTTTQAVAAALGAEVPLTGVSALVRADGEGGVRTCGCVAGTCGCVGGAAGTCGCVEGVAGTCGCVVAGRAVPRAPKCPPPSPSVSLPPNPVELRPPRPLGRRGRPPGAERAGKGAAPLAPGPPRSAPAPPPGPAPDGSAPAQPQHRPHPARSPAPPPYRTAATHLTSTHLLTLTHHHPALIALSPIGGQGFLLGRGNQQISPEVLRAVGPDKLLVLATESKLAALHGRPLLIDTGDASLDAELSGYLTVLTGRGRTALYRLSH
ncbi:NAD(+)/NADH kinase [Streptomyces sp. NBC_00237]|uniref:ATP-NAD kinase family protein n=1 Tax=Streptomyces sp. NBC_00237 TaxID=2975687 RepID=UPI0022573EB0|nr:NAD(+)/NADH kinase [Streptomyces sp. NBC_00237]MCX5202803.1 NAD(+)/NADH kinase [Streptomyces sp. NBC_00237]